MLAFLLAHGDEPLVLDQPEDDLDNHLIYTLVVIVVNLLTDLAYGAADPRVKLK